MATFTVSGQGSLGILSRTEVSFVNQPQYLMELSKGAVTIHFFPGATNFTLRVSNSLVFSAPEAEAIAEIETTAEGGASVLCKTGSIGVAQVAGPEAVFLKSGQSVSISPQGRLGVAVSGPAPPAPSAAPPPPEAKKSRKPLWILLGVAGAGAGGAAAALASRGGRKPVSPSSP